MRGQLGVFLEAESFYKSFDEYKEIVASQS
jgi:hypothetical protein